MNLRTWHFAVAALVFGVLAGVVTAFTHMGRSGNVLWAISFGLLLIWAFQVIRGSAHLLLKIGTGLLGIVAVLLLFLELGMTVKG